MKKNDKDFEFKNLPIECQDPEIKDSEFKFVQKDEKIYDQKFETKPTTFFKDSIRRFRKNKSSVVAAYILGALLFMSFLIPLLYSGSDIHDTSVFHNNIEYLQPKLFKAGTGFWDGTKKMTDIPVDTSSSNKEDWGPDYNRYPKNAVSKLDIGEEGYTSTPNSYAHGGYIQYGYFNNIPDDVEYVRYATEMDELIKSNKADDEFDFTFDHELYIDNFITYDLDRLAKNEDELTKTFPTGYVDAQSALYFVFSTKNSTYEVPLTEYKKAHDVGDSDPTINVKAKFDDFVDDVYTKTSVEIGNKIDAPRFEIRVKNSLNHHNSCTLIRSINFNYVSSDPVDATKLYINSFSFNDGNQASIAISEGRGYWRNFDSSMYSKETNYLVRATLCSFVYDTYEAALGERYQEVSMTDLEELREHGVISFYIGKATMVDGKWVTNMSTYEECKILKEDESPFIEPFSPEDITYKSSGLPKSVRCKVYKYKIDFGLDKMPLFLLGTDASGKDMLVGVFKGLRNSLLLGVITSAVCFIFGLFWGSVSGYFGGAVDLAMERLTDILSGVPWIVVMTIAIIKLGPTFFTFSLALCLTGWIGTASTTRTQFYRFRGREYVLASRTLGASNPRLIVKHILPNAMGTIITSAVLMVPSVIFSEATISYLGLGFQDLDSLGVILSENQKHWTNYPYLLIFPSIIIALVMISFNLFGNGLRDAVNPSLKGEGE